MSEPKIPAPLLVNLRAEAEAKARAAKALEKAGEVTALIEANRHEQARLYSAYQAELTKHQAAEEALLEQHGALSDRRAELDEHAKMHRVMVVGYCTANGLEIPELPAEPEQPPAPEPPAEPFVRAPADTRQLEYGTCACAQPIARAPGALWTHQHGIACRPDDPLSPHAEPAAPLAREQVSEP